MSDNQIDPRKYLIDAPGLWNLDEVQRMQMSIACRDTDYIPKVAEAGEIVELNGEKVQIMHEGMKVALGGYHGEWMAKIITELRGHHEPQEEKIFYEILQRLGPGSTMIEFGSFWAYYSLWFHRKIESAKNICCEPDVDNLAIGKKNAQLNNADDMIFLNAAIGPEDGTIITIPKDSDHSQTIDVTVRTVDSLIEEYGVDRLDLLHLDVQGFELDALKTAVGSIASGKVRFLLVSTHHYSIAERLNIHRECLEFISANGGHIIASHTVSESFSGDGLIAASFFAEDQDFTVETSLNHTDQSLFRSPEQDVEILAELLNKD